MLRQRGKKTQSKKIDVSCEVKKVKGLGFRWKIIGWFFPFPCWSKGSEYRSQESHAVQQHPLRLRLLSTVRVYFWLGRCTVMFNVGPSFVL